MAKKVILYSLLGLGIMLISTFSTHAQIGRAYPKKLKKPEVKIYKSGRVENYRIKAQRRKKNGGQPTATFEVTYSGFSDEAKNAFQRAVELWSYLISSSVPIKIDATWEALEDGVLGSASANSYRMGFKNAPIDTAYYPIAIANKLAGFDLEPGYADIRARFTNLENWYLGLDGNCPVFQYDLISVVMHEIGHGLGFIGSANVEAANGSWGYESKYPFIFDAFIYNDKGEQIIDLDIFDNPSMDLRSQLTSGKLYFISELSNNVNEGNPVKIYAPAIWNEGSSYSHLDETFNTGPNALMTYSVGSGEVIHDPGPITLAMFAEMGWMNMLFRHQRIKDKESLSEPIIIEAEIISDSALLTGSVFLHYSGDDFQTSVKEPMVLNGNDKYSATIPVIATDKISYYIEATDKLNRTYYHPSQGNLPMTVIDTVFYFSIGADDIEPEITHEPGAYIFNFQKELKFEFGANDNLGLDSAYIEYKINEGNWSILYCDSLGYSEVKEKYLYKTVLNVENLEDADTVYYRIMANDLATIPNMGIMPNEGVYKVTIMDITAPIAQKDLSFDENGDENILIYNGLMVGQPDGFNSKGLHSPHPYPEGDPYPDDEVEFSAMLKVPVTLKGEASYLRFDQIVIVEPGEDGKPFGHTDFWDYVIVEGSVDSAKTWKKFDDGYDSRILNPFLNAYNSKSDGVESMYASYSIDLLADGNFKAGDVVLIRFRLYSDQLATGWGWAIDNIEIQPDIMPSIGGSIDDVVEFKVYPSPSDGQFKLRFSLNEILGKFNLFIVNAAGQQVFSEEFNLPSKQLERSIDLTSQPSGNYFIKIERDNKVISKKVLIK